MSSNRDTGPIEPVDRLPLDGFKATWRTLDGTNCENLTISFENEAWTVQGIVSGIDVHYVVRLSAMWKVQQMLLFRDLDEPDLWLANDGTGRWGEINGSHRRELGGCEDVDVACSAFTRTLAIRRLGLDIGRTHGVHTVVIHPDSLAIGRARLDYTRKSSRTWFVEGDDERPRHEFDVDEFGLPLDIPGHFVRVD